MRDDWERLLDIQDQIKLIEEDIAAGRKAFDCDRHIRDSLVLRIANIGESCRAMSEQFRQKHPEIPWKEIIGMRSKLMHEYFEIDEKEVWNAGEQDIPKLRVQIAKLLKAEGKQ